MDTSTVDEIKSKVEAYESEIVSVASRLIQFPTISLTGETRECVDFIKSYSEKLGLEATFHEKKKNRTNAHVRVPGRPDKKLIWLGHFDVVPVGQPDKWSHKPFGGEVENGRVYGRGASDMKGSCAAAMVAAKALSEMEEHEHATVDLWFTCDEEVGAHDGTRWLVEKKLLSGEACVIGDAFGSVPKEPWVDVGCKGYLRTRLRAFGKTAHGSAPFRGDNAIDKLILATEKAKQIEDFALALPEDLKPLTEATIKFLLKEGKWAEPQKKAILRVLDYPTVSLGLIKAGIKINVVPDSAEASFDIRITPSVDPKSVEREMLRLLAGFSAEDLKVETIDVESGYYERWDSPFAESLKKAVELTTGKKPLPKILLGATDAVPLKRGLRIPCLGFGAGDEALAHAPDEYVTVENLVMATKVYAILPLIY
jgi:succinyl-diaminopimelate desuccinylase